MKENLSPVKEIKTGIKVVTAVGTNSFEAARPYLRRHLEKKITNLLIRDRTF